MLEVSEMDDEIGDGAEAAGDAVGDLAAGAEAAVGIDMLRGIAMDHDNPDDAIDAMADFALRASIGADLDRNMHPFYCW